MIVGTKAEFERLADFILHDYLGNAYDGYDPLDIQAFAKDYLKLDISYFAFDPDTGIEGMRTGNQIILDDRLLDDKKAGERNFTIAHECGHDLINWQDPSYSPQTVVNYRIKSSRKSLVTEDDFKEWQANVVASCLLLRPNLVGWSMFTFMRKDKVTVFDEHYLYPEDRYRLRMMACYLGVSQTCLLYRLDRLNMKALKDFDYNLWTTEENGVKKYFVGIKATGEVTEVDAEVMKLLRNEEKKMRRHIEEEIELGTPLSFA